MKILEILDRKNNKLFSPNSSLVHFYIFLFLIILLMGISSVAIAQQPEVFKKSIQIINPRPDFYLTLRLDKGTGAIYEQGERIRIYFKTSKNAYVTIFGYDTRGDIRLLFPNQRQKNHYVEANREYYIEGIIEPGSPTGIEYIQGFAMTEPTIIIRDLPSRLEKEDFPKMEEGIDRFTQRMKGTLTGLPTQKWVSSDILHYQVTEKRIRTGQLRINSSPEGAEVYLDDRYVGRTPLIMDRIEVGEHLVRVEQPGYQRWERTIQISPERTEFLIADLQKLVQYGSIAIKCNRENARIYLDGQYKGLTEKNKDVYLDQVIEGPHDIRVSLEGYFDWSVRVEVKPNQNIQLSENLEKAKKTGNLEIVCNVDNALIYLDGNYNRKTSANRPITIENIEEGNYELRIIKEGYLDYFETVRIYSDRTYRVTVKMQPEYQEGSLAVYCNENNAKIFINGIYQATTSANQVKIINNLKEGFYEVTIIKDGYHTWLEDTWVYPGETTSIFVDLVRIEDEY